MTEDEKLNKDVDKAITRLFATVYGKMPNLEGPKERELAENKPKPGIDCLKEELIKRGAKKKQVESEVVAMTLDILAETGNSYSDLTALREEEKALKSSIAKMEVRIKGLENEESVAQKRLDAVKNSLRDETKALSDFQQKKIAEIEAYIERFNQSLKACESDEGRDLMRRAQIFVNTCERMMETPQNKTAYINALGNILSGKPVGDISFDNKFESVKTEDAMKEIRGGQQRRNARRL